MQPNDHLQTNIDILRSVEPGDLLVVTGWVDAGRNDEPIAIGVKQTRSKIVSPRHVRKIYLMCSRVNVGNQQFEFNYRHKKQTPFEIPSLAKISAEAILLGEGKGVPHKKYHIFETDFDGYYQVIKCKKNEPIDVSRRLNALAPKNLKKSKTNWW